LRLNNEGMKANYIPMRAICEHIMKKIVAIRYHIVSFGDQTMSEYLTIWSFIMHCICVQET